MKEPGKQPPKSPISAHSTFSGDQLLNLPIVWNDRRLDDARIAFTYMAEFVKEQCIESQKSLSRTQVLSVRHLKTVYKEYNKTLVNPRLWHEQWFGQGENGTCQGQYVTPQLFSLQDIIREAKAKWPLECTDEAIERIRSIKSDTRLKTVNARKENSGAAPDPHQAAAVAAVASLHPSPAAPPPPPPAAPQSPPPPRPLAPVPPRPLSPVDPAEAGQQQGQAPDASAAAAAKAAAEQASMAKMSYGEGDEPAASVVAASIAASLHPSPAAPPPPPPAAPPPPPPPRPLSPVPPRPLSPVDPAEAGQQQGQAPEASLSSPLSHIYI
jgi:hypothetical protein